MIRNPYPSHPLFGDLLASLKEHHASLQYLEGLAGSSRAALIQACLGELKGAHLVIFRDKEEAAYFYTDLVVLEGNPDRTLFFPSSYKRSVQYRQTDEANIITRTQTLRRLAERRVASFIITYADALVESVMTKKQLGESTLELKQREKIDRAFLEEVLQTYDFRSVDFVNEPGQYAIRGGIVDVFSYASNRPFRIDFFGDEVESLRIFDADTQRSLDRVRKVNIIPNIQWEQEMGERRISFLEYIPQSATLWLDHPALITDQIQYLYDRADFDGEEQQIHEKERFLIPGDRIRQQMEAFRRVVFGVHHKEAGERNWSFNTLPQPAFHKNFELLVSTMKEQQEAGITHFILSENEKQLERLRAIFHEIDPGLRYEALCHTLHEGFVDRDLQLAYFTDHQVFERYHKFRFHDRFSRKESLSVKELIGLNPGDYVVHVDHGIGIFGGLEKIEVNGKLQEAIKLVYKDRDVLYVNIHSLHRISKYKGKDSGPPRIYKLGTGAWQKLKNQTRRKVQDIARELIQLYAMRKEQKGFAFSPDTYLQQELESSFLFEDTPDQLKATEEVKAGMEAAYPMDRLVCGDV
jgi:transcription-repair coupling factor (superfamily II helicase)